MQKSRTAAISSGDLYYMTGKPCMNGHESPRTTSNGNCTECAKLARLALAASFKKAKADRLANQ